MPLGSRPIPLLAGALVIVAASVMVLGILRLSLQWLAFRRRMRACCVVTEGSLAAALERILAQASIARRVRLLVSPALDGPGAFGLFRWSVVVPAGIDSHLSPHELRALLAHEVAHLVRGDARWLWIGRLLCFCLPIQPLNFLARRAWQTAAEFQCDDWAIRQRVQGVDLARCLTRIVELRLANAPRSLVLSAIGSESRLTQRIERILETPSSPDPWERRARVLRGAALVCFVVLTLCGPRSALLARDAESVLEPTTSTPKHNATPPVPPTDVGRSEQELLEAELAQLDDDLEALRRLLKQLPDDPELRSAVGAIEAHLGRLSARRRDMPPMIQVDAPNWDATR